MEKNKLFYGDNLEILKRYIDDESVDLIYLDPPFNSNQTYNVLFADNDGRDSEAQIEAFDDTWHWDPHTAGVYHDLVTKPGKLSDVMVAFRQFLGENDMMAYLTMMAPRLEELKRVLKTVGSIYLHCDPTASHYLKILMDAIFGHNCFKNEIVWHYTGWNKKLKDHFEKRHDVILFYSKSNTQQFNGYSLPWESKQEYVKIRKQKVRVDANGREYVLSDAGGGKRVERYLDEAMETGKPIDNVWEIDKLTSSSKERLGYPTQKPELLLERIITASSNEGDIILDPFCGCGTTVVTAQKLNRKWMGIDITHLAVSLMKHRLIDSFGPKIMDSIQIIGEPESLAGATILAKEDPYQFQWWILGFVGARPVEQKKGADKGIDGRINYFERPDGKKGKPKQIIFSVKAGKVSSPHIRDLRGVIERDKAVIGVFLSLNPPTRDMVKEAANAGFYQAEGFEGRKYAKIQMLTAEQLLGGIRPDFPPFVRSGGDATFRKAPRKRVARPKPKGKQVTL